MVRVICLAVVCCSVMSYADPSDDPGLVGWWLFNDNTARDWSQYGRHGVFKNGARVVYDAERGMVLRNSTGGHVDVGGDKLSGGPLTWADISPSYTIATWVKSEGFEKDWQALITKGSRTTGQMVLTTVGIHGRIYFRARGVDPDFGEPDRIFGNTFIDDGQWHHVAAVCEFVEPNTYYLRLYIDGIEEHPMVSPSIATGGELLFTDAPIYIGGSYGAATLDGHVYMDDVRIYNRALSPSEINEVMSYPVPADFTGDSFIDLQDFSVMANNWLERDYTISSNTGGLVGHWNFEGPAGSTTAPDLVGGNDAVLMGGASLDGNGAAALIGGPGSGQYVDLGEGLGQVISQLTESYTLLIDFDWYGPDDGGGWQKLVSFAQTGTTEFAMLTFVSVNEQYMRWQHRYNASDEQSNASTPNLKGRHQIAMVFNRNFSEFGSVQIYVDGVQKGFRTTNHDATYGVPVGIPRELYRIGPTNRHYLGKSPYGYDPTNPEHDPTDDNANYFDGKIYDFRIYDRALSAQDVMDVYQGTSRDLYFPLLAPTYLSDKPVNEKIVDSEDFLILLERWLEDVPLLIE